ncbi:hypothetical protein [Gynuella sunshinyii]|uniref:Uncharacterized protein n=1 Tax=Gynuella sunshinyii YC6258 TaxID=1445510 RepID=A0A0C5VR87_9GAMM|nr:hypothetical protein [Gynuella sunshinyii]AJQ96741.1 hypothetical Protein YC6258_04709 [Gynuella sunshinyii YC6258]
MSTGTWEPEPQTPRTPDAAVLAKFLNLTDEQTASLAEHLDAPTLADNQYLMNLDLAAWQAVADNFDDTEIRRLIRFFTLAEAQLPGWEAQEKSPVIWLCRILKQRGQFPDKELTRWIKAHTKNRFLPYGSVL